MIYQISRMINNNIVCSEDEKGRELILRGLGIGFGKKKGDTVLDEQVEKIYRMSNHSATSKLETLLSTIPDEQIELSSEIIDYAKSILPKKLSENINITLTDHINFALQRHEEQMDFTNPMLWETKRFYPTEYGISLHAIEMIEKRFGIRLSEDEAGFIALHIVNAELDTDMGNTVQITEMIREVSDCMRSFYNKDIDETSIHFERLITHLKFLGQRLLEGTATPEDDDELCEMVERKYAKDYECTELVEKVIWNRFHKKIEKSEKMYLTLHLRRVTM